MGIFSVPPDLPVTKSKEEIDKTYRYWRLHLMITSYIGYAVFYFMHPCRKRKECWG